MKGIIELISKHGLKITLTAAIISIFVAVMSYLSTDSAEGFIDVAYIFVGLALVLAVVLPVLSSIDNPKSFVKIGAGLVAVILVFGVCWVIADDQSAVKAASKVSSGTIRFSDALIVSTKFMLAIAVVGVLYTEIKTLFK